MKSNELPEHINDLAKEEGGKIFNYLIKQYPPKGEESLDVTLNIIIYTMVCLLDKYAKRGTEELFCELIKQTIINNVRSNR